MKAKLIKNKDGFSLYIPGDGSNKWIASTDGMMMDHRLSLKNCQAIERGYDLDELSEQVYPTPIFGLSIERKRERASFRQGFQKALEILGDKKFSEEDLERYARYIVATRDLSKPDFSKTDEHILKNLQQTEWDVEVEMEEITETFDNYLDLTVPHSVSDYSQTTTTRKILKFDADGCLILKRV